MLALAFWAGQAALRYVTLYSIVWRSVTVNACLNRPACFFQIVAQAVDIEC